MFQHSEKNMAVLKHRLLYQQKAALMGPDSNQLSIRLFQPIMVSFDPIAVMRGPFPHTWSQSNAFCQYE